MRKPNRPSCILPALAIAAALGIAHPAGAQGVDTESLKAAVLAQINAQRAANGLPPLQRVPALDTAAQAYSQSMMLATAGGPVYLSHSGPDGSTLSSRVSATGYDWFSLGEDLAAGQKTPQQVVQEWMGSTGHRENILSPNFQDAGIGIAIGPGTWSDGRFDTQVIWWTVDFGQPVPALPPTTTAAPVITGYSSFDGTPTSQASFGSLLYIAGQNLGLSGSISFHGQPTSAITWSPTAILALVPLQPFYPDVGDVMVTTQGQMATGPPFITFQPAAPPLVPSTPSWFPPAPIPAAPAAPTIRELDTTSGQPITAVPAGLLLVIRGSGFGANPLQLGRVLFLTSADGQISGSVWDWADDSITVFAPFTSGPVQVLVQADLNGIGVDSNRVVLTIQ